MLFGYWPPTDIGVTGRKGLLWDFRTLQEDWEESGYNIIAFSPIYGVNPIGQSGSLPYWGKGFLANPSTLQVDYRQTSKVFWQRVQEYVPIAIMSFSRDRANLVWDLEAYARNLGINIDPQVWVDELPYTIPPSTNILKEDYPLPYSGGSALDFSPYQGEGVRPPCDPPDPTLDAFGPGIILPRGIRICTLPVNDIVAALATEPYVINGQLVPSIDNTYGGEFVSEYMSYHVNWYRDYSQFSPLAERCLFAGHTHVGGNVDPAIARQALIVQLRELVNALPTP